MRDRAIELAEQGFHVFPLKPDCTPAFKGWQESATCDPAAVAAMWTRRTDGAPLDYNIGIATGRLFRDTGKYLNVIDVDVKAGKEGDKSLRLLEVVYEDLPPTKETRTASGGGHLFFLTPVPMGNSVQKIGSGLDVRGRGGYVVAPGSTKAGRPYTVARDLPLADCPEWLFEMAGAAKERKAIEVDPDFEWDSAEGLARAAHYLAAEAPPAVEGDGGDNQTFQVMCRVVRDFGLMPETALELALEHYNDRCCPPWDHEDLLQKAMNAYEHGSNAIGSGLASVELEPTTNESPTPLAISNVAKFDWSTKQTYLVRGLLNYGMVAMMSGPSNAGKSPLALDLASCIAKGDVWRGMKVKRGYGLYVSTEGWTGLKNRMEAVRRAHFPEGAEAPLDFIATSIDLRAGRNDVRRITDTVKARATHFGVPPALVIVDTLSHALGGGSDSDPEHARAVIRNCQKIAQQTGAAVLLLHHPTKDGGSMYRGSSLWVNDLDLLLYVEADAKTKIRTLSSPRVKEFAEIDPQHFRIKVVELGHDQEGDAITSVTVDWSPVEFADGKIEMTPEEKEALDALQSVLVDYDQEDNRGALWGEWWESYVAFVRFADREPSPKALKSKFNRARIALLHGGQVTKNNKNQYVIPDLVRRFEPGSRKCS